MAAVAEHIPGLAPSRQTLGRTVIKWITSTDHKTIGYLYLITSFVWFAIGGTLALLIRAELFDPGMQVFQSKEQYNQAFTMHGTIMLLLFATPLFAGFANVIMPLQIGAPDVAFPRLNMLAFWFFFFGGCIAGAGSVFVCTVCVSTVCVRAVRVCAVRVSVIIFRPLFSPAP